MTAAGDAGRGLFARSLDPTVAATTSGDEAALMTEQEFTRLYNANAGPILGYLVAVTGRRHHAEDLLQETFCRLLTARPRAMDATETRRYLFRIATNLLRDRWRRNNHRVEAKPYPETAEPSHTPSLETTLDVNAALQFLKPRERELLWLAYVEGLDHAEIAAATGLARLSVRMLLYRARNKAARLLSPERYR